MGLPRRSCLKRYALGRPSDLVRLILECAAGYARALTDEGVRKNGQATVKRVLVRWVVGVAVLLVIDIVAEALVFEWLAWNGTTKNDWFFVLWWLAVLAWTVDCSLKVWHSACGSSG